MKKLLFTATLSISIFSISLTTTFATTVFCTNCAQAGTQLQEFARQALQLGKDSISASQNTITAFQTTRTAINDTVLIPMRDAMTLLKIAQDGEYINNLVRGSLGTEPLLVANPELYLRNQGLGVARSALGDIASQNSFYGDSVMGSLIDTFTYKYSDLSTKLDIINESSIPSAIQNNICGDADLTRLATEQLDAIGEDYTSVDIAAKKTELYDFACNGDPNNDPALAKRLNSLNEQNPSIGGWDSWLLMTSGDNPYSQSVRSALEISEAERKRVEAKAADLASGGGVRSQTECISRAPFDENGEPYINPEDAPCLIDEITQTGSVVNSALQNAINSPLDTLISSFGSGAGSLISQAFSTINLVAGISGALGSISGNIGGGTGGVTVQTGLPFRRPNTPTTVTSVSSNTSDLNSAAKNNLLSVPTQQLNFHQSSLDSLQTTNSNYLSKLTYYQGQLDSTKSCYNNLASTYSLSSDTWVVSYNTYYNTESTNNTAIRNRLQAEINLIATTAQLISSTLTAMRGTNSSQELLSVWQKYQDTVSTQGLPTINDGPAREGEYITFQEKVDSAFREGGSMTGYNAQCASITAQQQELQRYQQFDRGGSSSD